MANALYDALFTVNQDNTKAFLHLANHESLTYKDFLELAAQIANTLVALGAKPGDRVAAQINKSAEALALYAACVRSGCVFLPLNTAYTPTEVSYFIDDAEPCILICDDSCLEPLRVVAGNCRLMTLNGDGSGSLTDNATSQSSDFATVDRKPDDLAAILYTSGTTGRSKGAMLTQSNLLSNAETLKDYWQFTGEDVLLHALPIYHTHGLFVGTNVILLSGASMILLAGFKVDEVIQQLPRATTMMGVPTFYTRLLDDDRLNRELVAHMRLFISGSAPLLTETHELFEQRTGQRILERYGMTETNMNASNPYQGERKAGTVGFALPGVEIKICHPETGAELPADEIGVLEVRGPNVFIGYWRMPEKTAEELRENGFFVTGDLAKKDRDGYVHIVGRDKDLIISGGFNIYPKEIELLLDEQHNVLESAVVSAPHADFGEGVVAVLVGQPNSVIDVDQIKSNIVESCAKYKQPKIYHIVEELPRNTMGKVQKNILREQVKHFFKS